MVQSVTEDGNILEPERASKDYRLRSRERIQIIRLIVAGYSVWAIQTKCAQIGIPILSERVISRMTKALGPTLEETRAKFYAQTTKEGLALREERIRRLVEHAELLEDRKLTHETKTGQFPLERAWRDTLEQIAEEVGHRNVPLGQVGSIAGGVSLIIVMPENGRGDREVPERSGLPSFRINQDAMADSILHGNNGNSKNDGQHPGTDGPGSATWPSD